MTDEPSDEPIEPIDPDGRCLNCEAILPAGCMELCPRCGGGHGIFQFPEVERRY